jgi:hypothetical protein
MWPTAAGLGVIIAVVWLGVILPRGRRLGWRPTRVKTAQSAETEA